MLHALLIDDEASARADLREKLRTHPGIVIVGEAATLVAARALLTSADYTLVFLDVQLIGGIAFDLLPAVRRGAHVVFVTAHERYALRAFECQAVDFLLKPISPQRLAHALHRAQRAVATDNLLAPPRSLTTVAGSPQATAPAVEIDLAADESSFLRQMLNSWEESLQPSHPLHARSSGVRTVSYERGTPPRLFLNHEPISAARRCWQSLRACFTR